MRFLRNRIRHDLLPFMAELTGASVVEALGRSAAAARAVVADLEERARADLARLATRDGTGWSLDVGALAERPIELAAEVLRQAAAVAGRDAPAARPGSAGAAPPARGRAAAPRGPAGPAGGGAQRSAAAGRAGGAARARGPRLARAGRARADRDRRAPRAPASSRRARDYAVPRERGPRRLRRRRAAVHAGGARPPPRRRLLAVRRARAAEAQVVPDRRGGPTVAARRGRRSSRRAGEIIWVAGIRRGSIAPVTATTTRILELAFDSHPLSE